MRYIIAALTLALLVGIGAGTATHSNRATAQADDGFEAQVSAASALCTVTTHEHPSIRVTLSASPAVGYVGDQFTYNYTVTNRGSERLYNITVVDSVFGAVSLPGTSLAPGASMSALVNRTY